MKNLIEFLSSLSKENRRLKGNHAQKILSEKMKIYSLSQEEIASFFREPKASLGSFESLPDDIQYGLSEAAAFDINERCFLTSFLLRILARGPVFKTGAMIVHIGWKIRIKFNELSGKGLIFLGRIIINLCNLSGALFLKIFRFTALYNMPIFNALWHQMEISTDILIREYIQQIPVDKQSSPLFLLATQQIMGCCLIGMDFMPSNGRLYFLEANFNVGHYVSRHEMFPEGDIVCRKLVEWALENKCSDIIFYPTNFTYFDGKLESAWEKMAKDKNINIEIIDDAYVGSPYNRRRGPFIEVKGKNKIIVNGRYIGEPVAVTIAKKGLLEKLILNFNKSNGNELNIPIPKELIKDHQVPKVKGCYPNIIVKRHGFDQAKGIELYKDDKLPEKMKTGSDFIAFEYLVPDTVEIEINGQKNKHIHTFRCYLLLTPKGAVFLGARKDVSAVPLSDDILPYGQLQNLKGYIVNVNIGDLVMAPDEKELEATEKASLVIGEVIMSYLSKKFRF
jgi:hypothetical protein